MTAPATTNDIQYDAYGNPIKAQPKAATPLALATGNQTAGNTTQYANVIPQTPGGAGSYLGQTITPGPAVDRMALAQKAWDTSTAQSAPAYEASLSQAKQQAAGVGQLGSGMLRTQLGNLALVRQRDMDTERQRLMNDAITGSISDQYQNIGIAQQQQGFQAAQQTTDFEQQLAAQQAQLQQRLGMGNLGVSQQQANTQQFGTTGNLALGQGQLGLSTQQLAQQGSQFGQSIDLQRKEQELSQLVATGQLTIAQKDQQLRDLQNQQQYGLAGAQQSLAGELGRGQLGVQQGQLGLAQLQNQQQFGLSGQQLELQRSELTQKYGAANADRMIEAMKVQNQQSQFTAQQGQQASQFTSSQTLQRDLSAQEIAKTKDLIALGYTQDQALAKLQNDKALSLQTADIAARQELSEQEIQKQKDLIALGYTQDQALAKLQNDRALSLQTADIAARKDLSAQEIAKTKDLIAQGYTQDQALAKLQNDKAEALQKADLDARQKMTDTEIAKTKTLIQMGYTQDQALAEIQNNRAVALQGADILSREKLGLAELAGTVKDPNTGLIIKTAAAQNDADRLSLARNEQSGLLADGKTKTLAAQIEANRLLLAQADQSGLLLNGEKTLAAQQAANQNTLGIANLSGRVFDPLTGKPEQTVESRAAQEQATINERNLWSQLAIALGITPPDKTQSGTIYNAPPRPQLNSVDPSGAWKWNGTKWVPNTGESIGGGPE